MSAADERVTLARIIQRTRESGLTSPRIADVILSSDWLARVKREAAAEALKSAAAILRRSAWDEFGSGASWLDDRADDLLRGEARS